MFIDISQSCDSLRGRWVPRERREAAWRDAVCNAFVRLDCVPDHQAAFHGRLTAGVVGELHVARVESSPQRVNRTRSLISQANEAFVLLSIQLRGRTVVEQSGSQAVLTPGTIAFYDTERPYKLTLPSVFDQIVLHLPRSAIEKNVPQGLDHMAQRIPASNPFAQAIAALAPQLLNLATQAPSSFALRTADAAIELISLALASIDQTTVPAIAALAPHNQPHTSADTLLRRARELIAEQLHDDSVSPQALAQQLNVSLRRLQEVFQQHGTTLSDCLWEMRLDFARARLAAQRHGHQTVSEIAYACGFSDTAHFSRRFKQRFGVTPSEFRTKEMQRGI